MSSKITFCLILTVSMVFLVQSAPQMGGGQGGFNSFFQPFFQGGAAVAKGVQTGSGELHKVLTQLGGGGQQGQQAPSGQMPSGQVPQQPQQ